MKFVSINVFILLEKKQGKHVQGGRMWVAVQWALEVEVSRNLELWTCGGGCRGFPRLHRGVWEVGHWSPLGGQTGLAGLES